jgi:hypothetical protein
MKACHNFLIGCAVALLAPTIASAQDLSGNVPMNEINAHAYRHFQKLFPTGTSSEYWFASSEGYQVSFQKEGHQNLAWFDRHGAYRYSLQYYPGKEIPRLAGDLIMAKYPGYRIDVVTEITDGEKTFYLVKIVNPISIKTLSVSDGKLDVLEELNNAGAETPLISLRSYP